MYNLKCGLSRPCFGYEKEDGLKYREEFFTNLKKMKDAGIEAIEMDMNGVYTDAGHVKSHDMVRRPLDAIMESGLILNSIHLPFGWRRDFSTSDRVDAQLMIDQTLKTFSIIDEYKPKAYVMHGACEPIFDNKRIGVMERMIDSLNQLVRGTKNYVCLENLPRTCVPNTSTEMLFILSQVPGLKTVCDVNHNLKEYSEDYIRKVGGDYIKTLHISDFDYRDERHLLPKDKSHQFKGVIDWNKVIGALEDIGYDGVFMYELSMDGYGYTFDQVRRNFDMLFEEYNKQK